MGCSAVLLSGAERHPGGRKVKRRLSPMEAFFLSLVMVNLVSVAAADAQESAPAAASPSASAAAPGGATMGAVTFNGKQLGFRGVYPGTSKRSDVETLLGKPASEGTDPSGLTKLVYPPDADLGFNAVYLDGDGVAKIGIARWLDGDRPTFKQLSGAAGLPSIVSPYSFLAEGQIYRFPDGVGAWGVMDAEADRVFTVVFYRPTDDPKIPVPQSAPRK